MTVLVSILTLVPWVLVAGLVFFLLQIARFYQTKYAELYKGSPGQRTYYPLFLVPMVLFVIAAGRYALQSDFAGDWVGDCAFLVSGIVLTALAYRLQRLMTGGRR
jgi:hypothetical protein